MSELSSMPDSTPVGVPLTELKGLNGKSVSDPGFELDYSRENCEQSESSHDRLEVSDQSSDQEWSLQREQPPDLASLESASKARRNEAIN